MTATPGAAAPVDEADAHEAALLDDVAGGDHEAVAQLYRRYERRLYGLGLRLLGDAGLAEELVQETFVRLWQSAARFDRRRGPVRALVFTIARRVAVDLHRRPSSRAETGGDAGRAPTPSEIETVLLSVTVRDAMTALSAAHREVLELVYDRDLTLSAAARELDVPLGTVKTRTWHALRAMRVALEERGWGG